LFATLDPPGVLMFVYKYVAWSCIYFLTLSLQLILALHLIFVQETLVLYYLVSSTVILYTKSGG
jgi:hypothetical protein